MSCELRRNNSLVIRFQVMNGTRKMVFVRIWQAKCNELWITLDYIYLHCASNFTHHYKDGSEIHITRKGIQIPFWNCHGCKWTISLLHCLSWDSVFSCKLSQVWQLSFVSINLLTWQTKWSSAAGILSSLFFGSWAFTFCHVSFDCKYRSLHGVFTLPDTETGTVSNQF